MTTNELAVTDRCCCGRIRNFTETVIFNHTMHERLGDKGTFCGPVDHHTMRDQEREIERLQARVEELETADYQLWQRPR